MQCQYTVADQVHRGLMAGAEQQDNVSRKLLVGELAAFFLRLHELTREIVARLASPEFKQTAEILDLGCIAGVGLVDLGPRERNGIEQPPAGACPVEEQLAVF